MFRSFVFLIIIICTTHVGFSKENILNEHKAIKLVFALLEKLEKDTIFTSEDDLYFFGNTPYNPSSQFLIQLGYLNGNGEILKKLPPYSFYGELLRLNRELLIENFKYKLFYASTSYFINKKREIESNNMGFYLVCVETDKSFITVVYDSNLNILLPPIKVNGKDILSKFCNPDRPYLLNDAIIKEMGKYIEEREKTDNNRS